MKTVITVIVDNTATENLKGEWGLSILVEHAGKKILLDAGASGLFAENLEKLGADISGIDMGVLSHAHYDHGNGIPLFFEKNHKAKFYLQEAVAENCYAKKGFFRKYIGIPKKMTKKYRDRIEYVSGDFQLCDGVWLIPHKTPGLSAIGQEELMYRRIRHRWKPDDFAHEQSLVLDTDKGLVILNSCCHGGAVNIINEVKDTFPGKHVHALIGGLHLFRKKEETIKEVARAIGETGIDLVLTGHCTKERAYGIMKEELGDRVAWMQVGLKMEF